MKVLLSHGYFLREDEAERKIMMPYPPQGLLHIGTFLKSKGIDCEIYDPTFKSFSELSEFLAYEKPKYLGLYANLMTRPNILKIIRFLRSSEELKKTNIILGGPDVRHHAEKYLKHEADYCIIGEGEHTLFKLIQQLETGNKTGLENIHGLRYRNPNKEIVNTGEPALIPSLDQLPFPDFELIDIHQYFSSWKKFHGYSSITISTMRGCPYSCMWCSKAVFGKTFRRRSARTVVMEMKRLQEKYAPDRFWIVDDVFTISKGWLLEFRNEIQKAKLNIQYECITRADKMDEEIINLLKASGCHKLWIGGESGAQKILDKMKRGVQAEAIRQMLQLTKNSGIEAGTFLMLGYPGEREADIMETVRHLKMADPDYFTLTLSYPIPGTGFYDEVKDKGLEIPGEWGTYSDRELDFKRTYRREYYQYAVPFVINEVKSHQQFHNRKWMSGFKHKLKAMALRTLMIANRKTAS